MTRQSARFWGLIALLLIVIAASRLTRLTEMTINRDEIWSVWQSTGTVQQILQWTPYDWPPLYYLSLGAWRAFAGAYPAVLRAFSALLFMLGSALFYRVMKRLRDHPAALSGTLAYAGLGFSILLSLEVRGYALLMGLLPLALWLLLRYFDHPGWRRALLLALSLSAMLYTSLTSVGALAILGLFALIYYGRRLWTGWRPALIFLLLAVPLVVDKASITVARVEATRTLDPGPLPQALADLYWDYSGFTFVLWAALFLIATVFIFRSERPLSRLSLALLAWTLAAPLALYLINPILGFFSARYAWWIIPGLALWTGWGLASVPLRWRRGLVPLLAVLCFVPLPTFGQYQIWQDLSPLGENFAWLRQQIQWGDVILDDPFNDCGTFWEWDYYQHVYFPAGLRFVESPGEERRLWVLNAGDQPAANQALLQSEYVPGRFVGPPGCTIRLYEAPPDRDGVRFANRMRFHGADIMQGENPVLAPFARHEYESTRLRLWWSVDEAVPLDYSVNTYLSWQGALQDSVDGPPEPYYPPDAPSQTSRWVPGQYYLEERDLSTTIYSGTYLVQMVVYFWEDGIPITAPGTDETGQLRIQRIAVKAY